MNKLLILLAISTISFQALSKECRKHTNGNGTLCGLAKAEKTVFIGENSTISGNVNITGNVKIKNATITGTHKDDEASGIWGNTKIENASLSGFYKISGDVKILGSSNKDSIKMVGENGKITMYNTVKISGDDISISGDHFINGAVQIQSGTTINGKTNMWDKAQISKTEILGRAIISGNSKIHGTCPENRNCIKINGNGSGVKVYGNAVLNDQVVLLDEVTFAGKANAHDQATFKEGAQIYAGKFEDNVLLSEGAYVWGNQTHLSGDTKVSGRYSVFNLKVKSGHFVTKDPMFTPEIFTPLQDSLLVELEDSIVKGNSDSKYINLNFSLDGKRPKAITEEQAIGLIKDLTNLFGKRLERTNDGCFLRAHVASIEADKKKIDTAKIVVVTPHAIKKPEFKELRDKSRLLRFKSDKKDHQWVSHFSNLVFIRDKDGNEVAHVIDPAMSKKPLKVSTWVKEVTKETQANDKNAYLSFLIMPKQVNGFNSFSRKDKTYQVIYNRTANTETLLNLLDEIGIESSMMADNYK